jgi:microcystin-dependent protein
MAISITKPTVGGSEDTWGTQINTALDTMVTAINDNTTNIATNTADIASNVFPAGGIIMWSGTIATIPTGWALCDGNNGTPDLTGRFVVHADGSTYSPNDTGGADTVTLSEAEMPAHTHSVSGTTNTTGAHSHTVTTLGGPSSYMDFSVASYILGNTTRTTSVAGDHSHTVSGTAASTGSGSAHENRPPYYALAYIMKT